MRNTRAIVMMGVAVAVAIGAVVVAAQWINAQASGNTNKVAVAKADISLGGRVTPELVSMVDWPASSVPPGAFTDGKLLETRVARASMSRGEPIMESKLAPPGTKGGLSAVVADGKRAMTVRVNDVVGVAGFALPGNFVDILVNTQDEAAKDAKGGGGKDQAISKIVLERILVLAIAQESSRDETKPKVVNAVTLELTPIQAEKLDLARSVGTLSLVLRNQIETAPVNTEGATKTSLLDAKAPVEEAKPVAAAKPAAKPAVKRVFVAAAAPAPLPAPVEARSMVQVEVIKGLSRSYQEF